MPLLEGTQPLYRRVSRWLADAVHNGELRSGDRVPPERWLCEKLGVSRATVRRALEELVADGLVEVRGRVPFVVGGMLAEPPNALMSLTELGRSRGLVASSRVLSQDVRVATFDEAEALGIAPGAELFELKRVRMLDGLPISLDHNRVPARFVPDPRADFTTASLYATLEGNGERLSRADYEIEAGLLNAHDAELLELDERAPALFTTTVVVDVRARVMDIGRTVYRADRYRFHATLMRRRHEERENIYGTAHALRRDRGGARDPDRRLLWDAGGQE